MAAGPVPGKPGIIKRMDVKNHESFEPGQEFTITQMKSVFAKRWPKIDIVISDTKPEYTYGSYRKEEVPRKYRQTVAILDAKDGRAVSGRLEAVPQFILDHLYQWGFDITAHGGAE